MKQLLICDDCKVRDAAPMCRTLGFGIEVQAFHDPRLIEPPGSLEDHKQAIHDIAPISVHGCFGDLCPGSFDTLVRGVARQRIEQSYGVATTLGARHLVFHHGYVPHTSQPAGWIKRSTEFWRDFLSGKNPNVRIHLENLLELDPELISDVVRSIDRTNLDINLDIGHAHCNSKTDVVKWIERLGAQIGYVHLHDNHGHNDEHLGLGHGTIPINEACQALDEYAPDAVWALEAEGEGIQQSLDWLGNNNFLKKK
ncbi:MAG: sugar phosphate isomerase/epimerase family protein [Victivallales bacterium]